MNFGLSTTNSGMVLPMTLVGAGVSTAVGALVAITLAHATGYGDLAFGASAVGGALGSFGVWCLIGVRRPESIQPSAPADSPDSTTPLHPF